MAKARLERRAASVRWVEADATAWEPPAGQFTLWRDRAVFHFLTEAADRDAYLRSLNHRLRPGGSRYWRVFAPRAGAMQRACGRALLSRHVAVDAWTGVRADQGDLQNPPYADRRPPELCPELVCKVGLRPGVVAARAANSLGRRTLPGQFLPPWPQHFRGGRFCRWGIQSDGATRLIRDIENWRTAMI